MSITILDDPESNISDGVGICSREHEESSKCCIFRIIVQENIVWNMAIRASLRFLGMLTLNFIEIAVGRVNSAEMELRM